MKKLGFHLIALLSAITPAFAAGVDSRAMACADLQALIAQRGFVFISQATFGDFVVSNPWYCQGQGVGTFLQTRTVATSDNPQCVVKYCVDRKSTGGAN